MQALDIIPGQSQMPQMTSRQGSSEMRLGSEEPQEDNCIVPSMPDPEPDLSQIKIGKTVQHSSFYPWMKCP